MLCPPPGDLPNPETELRSPALQVYSLPAEPQGKPKNVVGEINVRIRTAQQDCLLGIFSIGLVCHYVLPMSFSLFWNFS